jgi:hypothetical protein
MDSVAYGYSEMVSFSNGGYEALAVTARNFSITRVDNKR